MGIDIDIDIYSRYTYIYIYGLVFRVPTPHPNGMGPQVAPLPSICKLLAAFLKSSLVFAMSLQHF